MKELSTSIENLIENAGGTWGIILEDLDTNESWQWNQDDTFYAASIIKIPIMVAAFAAYEQGKFKLSDPVTLKQEDIVGGSGVLQYLLPGISLSFYDLIVLMIIQSDNTATNMLIDLIGKKEIQQTMQTIGLKKSKFYNKLMTVPVQREGNNIVTAKEMAFLLQQIINGKIVSTYACEKMIHIMKNQQIQDSLPGKLPDGNSSIIGTRPIWELAHKTGNVTKVRHDVGVFYVGSKTLIVAVLSKGIDDYQSKAIFHDIGLKIFEYLKCG